jgi:outer membrane protein assembly factor BamA
MMSINVKYYLLFITYLNASWLVSQNTQLHYIYQNRPKETITIQSIDSNEIDQSLQSKLESEWRKGYLLMSVDSIQKKSNAVFYYLQEGKQFEWAKITSTKSIIPKAQTIIQNQPTGIINIKNYYQYLDQILNVYTNEGFPFAKIKVDSFSITDKTLSLNLNIIPNNYYKIDSIIVQEKNVVSKKFLLRYLGLKEGMPYSDAKLESIQKKLNQLSFIQVSNPYFTTFNQTECKLNLFIKKQKTSRIDAIIGFLPTPQNKTIITGDISIKLQNELRYAEQIELNWRRLQDQTQDLMAGISVPYLPELPIGGDYNIKLYRRDTSFSETKQEIGINYKSQSNQTLRIFIRQQSNTNIANKNIFNTEALLQSADIKTFNYGLSWMYDNLDFRFNPRNGWQIFLRSSIGTREIIKNKSINESLYDNIRLSSTQYQVESDISRYIPTLKNQSLKFQLKYAGLFIPEVFVNESYRIGGLKSIRGINEESIFANQFAIGTAEYRYLFSRYSNLFAFLDYGWYESKIRKTAIQDRPIGFGTGINIETKAGIFTLVYALSKQFNNPIDPAAGKIHFGLTGVF